MPFRTPRCRGLRCPPDLQDTSMHRNFSRSQTSGRKPIWLLCFPELTIDPATCVTTVKIRRRRQGGDVTITKSYSPLKCSRPVLEGHFHLRCTTSGEYTLICNKEWVWERTIPSARMTTCSTRTTGSELLSRSPKSVNPDQYFSHQLEVRKTQDLQGYNARRVNRHRLRTWSDGEHTVRSGLLGILTGSGSRITEKCLILRPERIWEKSAENGPLVESLGHRPRTGNSLVKI